MTAPGHLKVIALLESIILFSRKLAPIYIYIYILLIIISLLCILLLRPSKVDYWIPVSACTLFARTTKFSLCSNLHCMDFQLSTKFSLLYIDLNCFLKILVMSGSKPGVGGIFSCFSPFLLHIICP